MDKFLRSLFEPTNTTLNENHSDDTDKIIIESLIYKKVGSHKKLTEVYNESSKYGARDGIMYECPTFEDPSQNRPEICAALAMAKNSNSPLYEVYINAMNVAKVYLDKIMSEYSNAAKDKIDTCEKILDNHDMVQDAIAHATSTSEESCCK